MILCEVCARIAGRVPAAASYVWATHQGRCVNYLCESCTSEWLLGCLEDAGLTPHDVSALSDPDSAGSRLRAS